ncbi:MULTISPECIES: ABC-type transport auxiliary lipoprotein family protein [unclassified Bradyrhizobium]|uniref:ABC-type transport auxiliary lipoprotein family protein n=1 Tax=unclassified Bradyrhizobium TaxID=2631580 RepID=UPI001BAE5237|nr:MULTISPECIES: MlaD family protein [unclassified Bradyrhizobium]MBR1208478.1 membrane integrity-associated transporter subunit PqiC [Bradyrhizobium sp. AUGA SZCCT0124]MBR1312653.1 membrane integrity-associated transporter subunit PqiC [Bradyrhizobium sp. AUGA SZCCT0051]MBR1341011.1 membrane integrity-associated transporter subunit PqiC [Bradyrhizobium sp. AUGA SZCCT0105]MBR1359765.1 membrane integrity-associated transporter subunit PqiC [Bradyrhizobium sp. AUGA SZCCT0045]
MEIRAPYIVIGAFVLSAIVAVFGFVYWLNNFGGIGKRETYQLVFTDPVPGLLVGAGVLFNGIRVGEVTALELVPERPREVRARIAVAERTPVHTDTRVGLDFQGLTGVPVIALEGGDDPQAPPAREPLVAEKGAGRSMTQAARDALRRVDAVLSDNAAPLHSTIDNLSTFAEGLARNTPKLDGIVAGLERMTGGASAPRKVAYDLHAVDSFGAQRHANLPEQLVMAEPTAIARLQTQRFLFTPDEETQGFEGAQWSDSLPVLVQARLLQSFENYDVEHAPLRADSGVEGAPRLLIDLRRFEIVQGPQPRATISLSAKIVDRNGQVKAAKLLEGSEGISSLTPSEAAAAFDKAFGTLARELVMWVAATA